MSHIHAFPMHMYSLFNILVIFELLGTFLIVFHSLLLFLFTLVVSMAPKRKSTSTWNPLHSGASSPSDSAPLSLQFRDDDAYEALGHGCSPTYILYRVVSGERLCWPHC